ncbi:MAG: GGDEF domain-containing protein, partial [Campylobacterota bacterium]|nr:GGDEF domain-containing protein [Campylobacterota bacterium]
KYYTSIENSDYMFTMSHHISHKKLQSSELLLITPNKEYIKKELQKGVSFSFYQEESKTDKVYIITFDPIKNIKGDKISAYIVSYVESKELKSILSNEKITVGTLFLLLLIIFVFIHHAIMHRKELLYEINHDSLTDVFNRKYFFEAADTYASKYLRLGDEFSIVMADIDWFKKVNDEYGHQCGDVILKDIATILSHNIATNDIVARYGGEEFILLMKSHEYDAHSTIQKVQKAILEHQFKCSKNEDIKITLSFGITQFKKGLTISETIKRADNALYNSKENGRNQISFA